MENIRQSETQSVPLHESGRIVMPAMMIPSFRTSLAVERGVEKNILMKTWGGLGDQICAEPTLRFAINTFKGCDVSLASECPELFDHLPFKKVFDLREIEPKWDKYYSFNTIWPNDHLQWEFMSHMICNCVDYVSLCAFRCQLPVREREVRLVPKPDVLANIDRMMEETGLYGQDYVVIHAGRHWQSKTFPRHWWNSVLGKIRKEGALPVLIGANTDDNRGTVNVSTEGCLDLRNKLKVMETVALLQRSKILLTNDSSPLHMAVSGDTWIGYIATCKHPDMISHWRKGQWSWRMKNFGLGGIWDVVDYCPNRTQELSAENVGDERLRSWLPDPETFADWALEKFNDT
jgi:hypothetical protein